MPKPRSDDMVPDMSCYPYAWKDCSNSGLTISEFVAKYRPSMVQDDGTKPWIWVISGRGPPNEESGINKAVEEGSALLEEVTEKMKKIQNDPTIPVRANKKKGTKSKKELREAEQAQATEKLKAISTRSGFVSGKWLVFAPAERIDAIWTAVAMSLVSGPLSATVAFSAKVATTPKPEMPNYQHVICIYMPNVYDKNAVIDVYKVLLRSHGLSTNGVKPNLYTHIGLDSKHPSGIPSTASQASVWKSTTVLPDTEIKRLRDAYFEEMNAAKARESDVGKSNAEATMVAGSDMPTTPKLASKSQMPLKLKRKAGWRNPFASDSDDNSPSKAAADKGNRSLNSREEDDEPRPKKICK
ncbi:hypothetical protein K488DRAFT_77104 [Vararia minispora EC-137]|uniref:Uncharacterized protein n=1 Tax=Vararia minispora EC-137 TaxID=1314806 RepID=A0ACB8QS38_9AGAM|nr:hypothetical protein K488DRAFT_77104 [Vararia minispora EC-137]